MYQQTSLLFYKFRFLLAGIFTIAFLVAISAMVTSIGSGTVLAHPATFTPDTSGSNGPNVVAAGASAFNGDMERALVSTGAGAYGACKSVTAATVGTGRAIGHGSVDIVGGIWGGTWYITRGTGHIAWAGLKGTGHISMGGIHAVGAATMFTLRLPGKALGSIGHGSGQTVSDIIRPSDDTQKDIPTIDNETSAAVLARLTAAQQQEISKLQASQLAANQQLDGSIQAGDPKHGGYPAKWDNIAQDSTVDSWGMYNRECVSYAAWKVYETYHDMPYWGGVGNANEWVRDAQRAGIATGSTPAVHSVAIWRVGYYGHAMWVEKVSGDMIYVSQYNYDLHGHYSEMWVKASRFTYIYFH